MPTGHSTSRINWLLKWEPECVCRVFIHSVVTVSCSYCSLLPPLASAGRKPAQRVHVCVRALRVYAGERTSSLVHIILNRIFPSRVLLPPSFRSLPQGSGFSRKSAASLRGGCLFWSVIVPELPKPWVSTTVAPCAHLPRVAQLLNDCFYVT